MLPATYVNEKPIKETNKTSSTVTHKDAIDIAQTTVPQPSMTKGQLCKLLEKEAVLYLKESKKSIHRNIHQFSFRGTYNHKFAMAILIDYINFVGMGQGLDLGLEEKHILNPEN
jgi:hypothetical protein